MFTSIWLAGLLSRFGGLIQIVGASWLMTSLAKSADMVALVQTAILMPIMLLSLVAGASADAWDRRGVMLISQYLGLAASVALALLAYADCLGPWTLLLLMFITGCGAALYQPAWQSSLSEQVPQSDLSAAISLDSLSLSLARTLGPPIGGALLVAAGPTIAFVVNSATYVGLIAVLAFGLRERQRSQPGREPVLAAMAAGISHACSCRVIRTLLLRSAVFGLLGSATWALMPLVAQDLLRGNADLYGWLFGSWGAGAILGALYGVSIRLRFSNELILRVSSAGVGIGILLTAASRWEHVTMAAQIITGGCWVVAVSTLNVSIQASSPARIVGRVVAIFHTVLVGGLTVGSLISGLLANEFGLVFAMQLSGAFMTASLLLGWVVPLRPIIGSNADQA